MDKETATKIIGETFNSAFDKERFVHFTKNLLNSINEDTFIYRGNYIPDAYDEYVKTLERVGKYTDPEGKKVDILIVNLKKETSLEYARTMQRNFIAWYLDGSRGGEQKEAALVAFVAPNGEDWRFSLVKMDYTLARTETGRIKAEKELTPARRWSFLVGEHENSHTAQRQLFPILKDDTSNPSLADLEEAFNIEVVTKEFFEKYRQLFDELVEELEKLAKKDKKIKAEFEKGTFLYDQEDISKKEKYEKYIANFAKKLLGQIVFLYFLQKKGWFGVDLKSDWGSGPKDFLRELYDKKHGDYTNFFDEILEPLFYEALAKERDKDYYSRFKCRIPFLNGGLFDPLGNYDWVNTKIQLPNEIFSNKKKTKQGDIGTGILDVFDRYNFTVKEDEPLEKDVAVDPEMLGKVFENLLEVKDRKSKGTYYTPREIVHYMCQESLTAYLSTELEGKVSKEDIETLIKYGESFVEHDARVVENGKETATYSYKLPESIRKNAKLIDEKLEEIRVCDPAVGSGAFLVGMMSEIIRTRNALTLHLKDKKTRTPYNFKRHAIQNSLYGVDIDAGAVEIAKLRLWLSLIVDESEFKEIQPLPNLDYKIVAGNSLLSVEKDSLFLHQDLASLKDFKQKYFDETSAKKKEDYKKQIDALISKITNGHKEFDFEIYFSEIFEEKGGFDVVIANPPYGAKFSAEDKEKLKKEFSYSIKGKFESYRIFVERGVNILKKCGVLTYVVPNTWLYIEQAKPLREFILDNLKLSQIIQFPQKTFQATVDSISFLLIKQEAAKDNEVKIIEIPLSADPSKFAKFLSSSTRNLQSTWNNTTTKIISYGHEKAVRDFVDKISSSNSLFSEHVIMRQGLIPYLTKQDGVENKYIAGKKKSNKWKPFLDGSRFVGRYHIKGDHSYILYGDNLYAPREAWIFKKPRIMFQLIRNISLTRRIVATFLDYELYSDRNTGLMFEREKSGLDLKYVLGVFNSSLINFIYSFRHNSTYISFPSIKELPLANVGGGKQKPVIALVDRILAITKDDDYLENPTKQAQVREYEKQIDQLVYKLYGLTKKEIEIIEDSVS